jgi:hypothetical protein
MIKRECKKDCVNPKKIFDKMIKYEDNKDLDNEITKHRGIKKADSKWDIQRIR